MRDYGQEIEAQKLRYWKAKAELEELKVAEERIINIDEVNGGCRNKISDAQLLMRMKTLLKYDPDIRKLIKNI